ncbi:hypothetical protein V5799_031562 [Amblyomma americanum]|uniref:Uncharacterized protein n=1 Tax=Amblyomma americanum TaxID=6943 RepID=A0AAQ4DTP1_AMBAM
MTATLDSCSKPTSDKIIKIKQFYFRFPITSARTCGTAALKASGNIETIVVLFGALHEGGLQRDEARDEG